jgi:hypothetical protein
MSFSILLDIQMRSNAVKHFPLVLNILLCYTEPSKFFKGCKMKLEDFRINIARLSRPELSALADVSASSIKRAEDGQSVSLLTRARILAGLSQHLGREVKTEEIDEFKAEN